ncbi:hypothetical protein AK812_SmicGene43938 [Symbiodinium microadriaticum]|uniref:Uncharacterized protein n=1 Tax=Symbiodinium microadriaticum TaxID=2951 RepID=A0A1Q9BZR3_SYMMI|nr:hypothetical protein AK812_SmicGene43938 [Symbiodinium microadriaticum]
MTSHQPKVGPRLKISVPNFKRAVLTVFFRIRSVPRSDPDPSANRFRLDPVTRRQEGYPDRAPEEPTSPSGADGREFLPPNDEEDSPMDFEVHTPEEWLALCKQGPTAGKPQAAVLHYAAQVASSRYIVELEDGSRKQVKRLALRFNEEDAQNFALRAVATAREETSRSAATAVAAAVSEVSSMLRDQKERFIRQGDLKGCPALKVRPAEANELPAYRAAEERVLEIAAQLVKPTISRKVVILVLTIALFGALTLVPALMASVLLSERHLQIWLLSQPDPLELAGFEKALVAQLASRSMADPKLFGRMLTTQDTEGRFVSCLKTSTRGNSFIKLKVCLDRVRLWDAQGQPLHEPGDLTNRECKVRPELRQVWMMSGQCGLLIEVTDLMLREEENMYCCASKDEDPQYCRFARELGEPVRCIDFGTLGIVCPWQWQELPAVLTCSKLLAPWTLLAFSLDCGYESLFGFTLAVSILAEGASLPSKLRAFAARECGKLYYSSESLLTSPSARLILESLSRGHKTDVYARMQLLLTPTWTGPWDDRIVVERWEQGVDWLDGMALLGIEAVPLLTMFWDRFASHEARALGIWKDVGIRNECHILYDAYQFRGAVPVGDELLEVKGMLHLDLKHPWRLLFAKGMREGGGGGTFQTLQCGLDFARDSSKQMKDAGLTPFVYAALLTADENRMLPVRASRREMLGVGKSFTKKHAGCKMTRDLRAYVLGGIVLWGSFVILHRLGRRGKPRLDPALCLRRGRCGRPEFCVLMGLLRLHHWLRRRLVLAQFFLLNMTPFSHLLEMLRALMKVYDGDMGPDRIVTSSIMMFMYLGRWVNWLQVVMLLLVEKMWWVVLTNVMMKKKLKRKAHHDCVDRWRVWGCSGSLLPDGRCMLCAGSFVAVLSMLAVLDVLQFAVPYMIARSWDFRGVASKGSKLEVAFRSTLSEYAQSDVGWRGGQPADARADPSDPSRFMRRSYWEDRPSAIRAPFSTSEMSFRHCGFKQT